MQTKGWTLYAAILVAQARGIAAPASYPSTTEQWGAAEVTLRSSHRHSNPFTEVTLAARFVCSGQTTQGLGFFDGGDTWKIRFMPMSPGTCQFSTISNDSELNNVDGTFKVSSPSKGNHGPVHVAKTWHFSYADGTPYFLLGTTLYNWINRAPALQSQTLSTLSKSPFTKIRFCLFPKWYEFNRIDPPLYPYVEVAPHKFDLDRFDTRFFQHVESQLRQLQALGIEADVILFHPYDRWGFAGMDADHDDAYIRYVAARLSAFRNVWWTMANEYDLFDPEMGFGSAPKLKTKDWDRMFRALEAADPYGHPRGIHNLADWYDHGKSWVTHAIIQDGMGNPGRRVPEARGRFHKPAVVDEYGYEGNNGNDWGNLSGAEEVSRHWDITMQGGYGSHGETIVNPGGVLWWAAGGSLAGESPARLAFLRKIMTEGPYQDLVPSPDIVQGGEALAWKGEYYLFRIKVSPGYGQHVQIRLEEGRRYGVDLIDPWSMRVYSLGVTSGGLQAFDTHMAPCLLRFTLVPDAAPSLPVHVLIAKFLNDPTTTEPPATAPMQRGPDVYGPEYSLGELMDNPKTAELVKQYLPNLPKIRVVRIFTLERLQSGKLGPVDRIGDVDGLVKALRQVRVERKW